MIYETMWHKSKKCFQAERKDKRFFSHLSMDKRGRVPWRKINWPNKIKNPKFTCLSVSSRSWSSHVRNVSEVEVYIATSDNVWKAHTCSILNYGHGKNNIQWSWKPNLSGLQGQEVWAHLKLLWRQNNCMAGKLTQRKSFRFLYSP